MADFRFDYWAPQPGANYNPRKLGIYGQLKRGNKRDQRMCRFVV